MSDTDGATAPKNQAKVAAEKEGSAGPNLLAPPASNSEKVLADWGREATKEHDQIRAGERDAFEHAVAAGKSLLAAKNSGLCPHGAWERWCKGIGIPSRTASRYMRLAERHGEILAKHRATAPKSKSACQADLTIARALRLLGPSRPRPKMEEPVRAARSTRTLG
jgi:hypothetical protein